ncbi:MAG: HAD-IA family hydrolase [Proteobacteria bacterium]|nr:HAD-IA family hydrolase [Pseudomonadota bacterium]
MISKKPKAVIFDWDDTIVDSWPIAMKALNAALVGMGQEAWSDDEARRRCGGSARDLFHHLFGDRWQEADKIYYDTFVRLALDNTNIHLHVEDILKFLTKHKVYLAVVSNKRGHLLRSEAEHLQFNQYFDKIVGAGDAAADKPDPAPVHMALQDSGISADADVWFVGDSHTDMICASNAGCTAILVETKAPPEEMLVSNPPALRFKKHHDFMEFIKVCFSQSL